jgi:hypothetical protein
MCALPGLSTKQLKELGKEVVVDVWELVHSDEAAVTVFDSDDVMADDNVDIVSAPSC